MRKAERSTSPRRVVAEILKSYTKVTAIFFIDTSIVGFYNQNGAGGDHGYR